MALTYEQKVYQWASGHYLDDDVPNSFFNLSDQEQLTYLEDYSFIFYENCSGKFIHQLIWRLANAVIMKEFPEEELAQ